MIIKRFILLFIVCTVAFSCKKQRACWCTALVTVDSVQTTHKYKVNIVSKTKKDGRLQCNKQAQDTQYSEINCALYDY